MLPSPLPLFVRCLLSIHSINLWNTIYIIPLIRGQRSFSYYEILNSISLIHVQLSISNYKAYTQLSIHELYLFFIFSNYIPLNLGDTSMRNVCIFSIARIYEVSSSNWSSITLIYFQKKNTKKTLKQISIISIFSKKGTLLSEHKPYTKK